MRKILGKIFMTLLWLCFFILLGGFFWGLARFNFQFVPYITYLNSLDITHFSPRSFFVLGSGEVVSNQPFSGDSISGTLVSGSQTDIYDPSLEELFFQGGTGTLLSGDSSTGEAYGFIVSEQTGSLSSGQKQVPVVSGGSVSGDAKQELLHLIQSREQ